MRLGAAWTRHRRRAAPAARLLLLVALTILARAVAAAAQPPPAPAGERAALDRAYAHLAHREFAQAQAEWRPVALAVQQVVQAASATKRTPAAEASLRRRFGEVVFLQGLIEARLGRKQDALELLRKADGYGFPPLDSPLMSLAADCLLELDEPALAAQAYREIVKASPANVQARLRLGASFFAAGQLEAAATQLEDVLRREPGCPRAHFYLGAVRLEQRRGAEAKAQLAQELQQDPRCNGCMAKLAYLAYLDGDDRDSESWLRQAVVLDPADPETNLVYGMLENRAGRPELAIGHLLRVVERAPGYAKARYQLALAYQRSGNTEKAREQRAVYDRLLGEQQARGLGVRGSGEQP
jgi:tetratricopeptide (TPR) repeat protein